MRGLIYVMLALPLIAAAPMDFQLSSLDFLDGQPLPTTATCDGANQSPRLTWSNPPIGTKSFAIVEEDLDGNTGVTHDWGVYDIGADVTSIDQNGGGAYHQTYNDGGDSNYKGPCPSNGSGPNHYVFTVYALNVASLKPRPGSSETYFLKVLAERHSLASAQLTGSYERP